MWNHAVEFILRAIWARHLQKPMESGQFLDVLRLDMPLPTGHGLQRSLKSFTWIERRIL